MNNYNVKTTTRVAAPRSKKLRELGSQPSTSASVTVITSEPGQSSVQGGGHVHTNLEALEAIRIDELFYLWLQQKIEGEDESKLEKVKAGFADEAEKAKDSEKWCGNVFNEWLNQPVRKEDWVEFLGAIAQTIKTPGYVSGLTGTGAIINKDGSMEADRLTLRKELIVPKLVYNMVDILVGDEWRAPGGGVIEKVVPDVDANGDVLDTGTFYLELKKGQIGAVYNSAICMGIFHDYVDDTNNATEDYDDGYGNRRFAGFTTSYFTITEISNYIDDEGVVRNKGQVRYKLRPASARWTAQKHPYEQMNFVCYGIFSDNADDLKRYGTAVYQTRTYTRMLVNQNTWEFSGNNIALQYGEMNNLLNFGVTNPNDYALYVGRIYTKGSITQVRDDGTPILTAIDRGEWKPGTVAAYYDRYSRNGSLWLCIAEGGTSTVPSEEDPAWLLQVRAGYSINVSSKWRSNKVPYPQNAMLTFAGRLVISNKETSQPPYPLITDSAGNYITDKEGYYIMASDILNEDWYLLIDKQDIVDGKDGDGLEAQFSADGINWHYPSVSGDIWIRMRVGDNIWGDPIRVAGEAGRDGVASEYPVFEFAVSNSITEPPTTGWTDGPHAVGAGQYLWMRTGTVIPPAEEPESWSAYRVGGEKGDKGDKGDGYNHRGDWSSDKMPATKMDVFRMGGSVWVALCETNNPPIFCVTDKSGNRLLNSSGGYILTGVINTEEYSLLLKDGEEGKPGQPGAQGKPGTQGIPGSQGIQGCIVRYAEWQTGYEWRNDEALTAGTRYIDFAFVRNTAAATGYNVYKCKTTHTSSSSITTTNTAYWEEVSINVPAIFTNIIIGTNAHIDLMQGNDLLVKKSDATVTAGMSGSQEGNKTRIWAGATADNKDTAPFRVDESGVVHATKAHVSGEVNASSGSIAGFEIANGRIGVADGFAGTNTGLFLTNEMIGFNAANRQAIMGLLSNLGSPFLLRLIDHVVDYIDRTGLVLGVTGSKYNNVALELAGGHIKGAAFRTRNVSYTTTLSRDEYSVACINTSEITITLPTMYGYDDGHVVKIKTLNSGKVKIKPGINYDVNGNQHNSYIAINSGSIATSTSPAAQDNQGDSAEYIYHRDLTSGDYKGCWIQYKHPRGW